MVLKHLKPFTAFTAFLDSVGLNTLFIFLCNENANSIPGKNNSYTPKAPTKIKENC